MKSLAYLNKYFIKYKWRFLLGIVFTIASNYFGVQMTLYTEKTIDKLSDVDASFSVTNVLWLALFTGGIYMLIFLGKGFFLFLMRQTTIIMSRLIEYDLKNEIFQQYEKLDYSFYKKHRTGDLMNRISEDVSQVRMYLGPGVMYTVNLLVMSIMIVYQMAHMNWKLTIFVLIPLPIMSFMIYKVSSKMSRYGKNVQEAQSNLTSIAQETFAGIRIFKAHNKEHVIEDKFDEASQTYKDKSLKLTFVNAFFMPTIVFLIGASTLTAIYVGGLLYFDAQVSKGQILAFVIFINQLTWPFASLGWVTSIIQRAAVSQKRINDFLNIQPEIVNPSTTPFHFKGKIEFKNVSYTYRDSNIQALKNVNFTIEPNQTLAILGKTGSGKSTILSLLLRQIDPDQGEILIDGVSLKDINLVDYREMIGMIPQDVFLFSDTIYNNIAFGLKTESSMEAVENAAKKAHVHHNIIAFPEQYQTLLGERGVNLSGGQKQRISIARALIKNPSMLLIDDCLSAVDTETEETILKELSQIKCTSLIVSHRISTIRNAGYIIFLDNGEIKEEGTQNQLLAQKGSFYELYQTQAKEQVED